MTIQTSALAALIALCISTAATAQPVRVHLDQEATVGGLGVACTGIGQTKNDPKWQAYPVRVEFAGPGGEYLADETLRVADSHGQALLDVSCEGPWILLKLTPGQRYTLGARVKSDGPTIKESTIDVPRQGQGRFVFTFPDTP
jgi:hypothetical protein